MLSSLASAETNGQLLREFGAKKIKYIYTINNSDFSCTTCIFRSLTAYTMQEARNNQQSRKPSSWTDETIIFFFLSFFIYTFIYFIFSLFQTTGFLEENRCALDTVRSPLLHELEIYKQNGEMLVIARVKICVSFKCFF